MQKIEQIIFHGHVLDVYNTVEDPLFLAVEVARMIDYSVGNTVHMLDSVDDNEKVLINVPTRRNSTSGAHNTRKWFLTEDGLYEVLMQSRKPVAKRFKRFVKDILRDMRRSRNETPESWFRHLDTMADFEVLNHLREDMGLDHLTLDEFLN